MDDWLKPASMSSSINFFQSMSALYTNSHSFAIPQRIIRYGIVASMGLKENLQQKMDAAGLNPHSLASKTKVPQPTIHRILDGTSKDPRRATLGPLAKFFGVTVDELCGLSKADSGAVLNQEQERMLTLMASIDKDARETLLKMGELLARRPIERRNKDIGHNPERRIDPYVPLDPHDTRLYEHDPIDEIEQQRGRKKQ